MRLSVVGPITCLSRTLPKSSGILKVVTKRQEETRLKPLDITLLYIHTQEDCAVSCLLCRSHLTRFVREIKQISNGKQRGRHFFLLQCVIMVFQYQNDGTEAASSEN